MNIISFDKGRPDLEIAMERWCMEHIGRGMWAFQSPKSLEEFDGCMWTIHNTIFKTTFTFMNPSDLTLFVLRWA